MTATLDEPEQTGGVGSEPSALDHAHASPFFRTRWNPLWHTELDAILADLHTKPADVQTAIRKELAKDPVAFAIVYFPHHLKDVSGDMTFSQIHYEWANIALAWPADSPTRIPDPVTGIVQNRDAIIGPRESGKSTWNFLILPMWAMANLHKTFIAAFASAATQAEAHLLTMRNEMDQNSLLQHDFPDLCKPARRRSGGTIADRGGMIHMANGCIFAAKGMDSALLGMKIGAKRPDLLILDDIEPDEANYSADQAVKRLGTVTDAIFPLNFAADVVLVGTVTMPGSIMHQCVKAARGVDVADWIADEKIRCHYYPAILTDDDGNEVSIWPGKWPLSWLQSIRHTRSYAKNYDNDPMAREGVYWLREDFRYGDLEGCTRTALFIDPAVTTKKTSDYTGIAVISYKPAKTEPYLTGRKDPITRAPLVRQRVIEPSRVVVRYSAGVKLTGSHLRDYVVRQILPKFPAIRLLFVESNQGGDMWSDTFAGIPNVKVQQHNSTTSKEVRFGESLEFWQTGRVLHARRWDTLEEQAVGFPKATYDDVVDAAVSGVRYFLLKEQVTRFQTSEASYL